MDRLGAVAFEQQLFVEPVMTDAGAGDFDEGVAGSELAIETDGLGLHGGGRRRADQRIAAR